MSIVVFVKFRVRFRDGIRFDRLFLVSSCLPIRLGSDCLRPAQTIGLLLKRGHQCLSMGTGSIGSFLLDAL